MIYIFCLAMKNSLSWITLINWERHKNQKFWWDPKFTNAFLNSIEAENKEWKIPPAWDIVIYRHYDKYHGLNSKYTINREWEVKSLRWEVMKPSLYKNKRWQKIHIRMGKIDSQWKMVVREKEIWILVLMEQVFWRYFPWYKLKQKDPENYILVPKDWDYNNMRYDNLIYVYKDEYYSPKRKLVSEYMLMNPWVDDEKVSKVCNVALSYVKKIKMELAKKWKLTKFWAYQDLQKELWVEFSEDSFQIYQALMQSQWNLSNLEIAKLLRSEEINSENQKIFTNKVSRVRKRLTDKWIIPRFNEWFESKRDQALKMIMDKGKTHITNQEIADTLWLKKSQIDNLSKSIKKKS